jgi:hypothetical protein
MLSALKDAGADLIFVSKWAESLNIAEKCGRYDEGVLFVSNIEKVRSVEEVQTNWSTSFINSSSKNIFQLGRSAAVRNYFVPWETTMVLALAQSARKYGVFLENECNVISNRDGHVKTANEEDVFAIVGFTASYLFCDGSWRFFIIEPGYDEFERVSMNFMEYDKNAILKHFNFNLEQLRLLGTIARNLRRRQKYKGVSWHLMLII